MTQSPSIVHLNVVNFPASVAIAKDRTLADKAFVVAGTTGSRAIVLDVSRRARMEGLRNGMQLEAAERRVKDLLVLRPDPVSYARATSEMERLAAKYAPLIQNDDGGHLYLDLAGTVKLFGPHVDVAVRIRNEIVEAVGIEPAVGVAANKLVAKVATRSIRPSGIASIRSGEEAAFMASQDALLLPGVGPAIARVLKVAELREIGEIASLTDAEALALFGGRRGLLLRDAARGIDDSPVAPGGLRERVVTRRLDFASDILGGTVTHGALVSIVEDAGFELRKSLLAAHRLRLAVQYSDGQTREAGERTKNPWTLDVDLISAADRAFHRAADRRLRIRSFALVLSELSPAKREPDLFIPETRERLERLQAAIDVARRRYGQDAVTRGSVLAALMQHA